MWAWFLNHRPALHFGPSLSCGERGNINLPQNLQSLFFRVFSAARIETLSAKNNNWTRRIGLALAILRVA